uniref:preprotein translocase subunit G n=1 Tax=Phymatolithon calcareum TaxID=1277942 RepID=UPI0023F3021C|nr:preprotein translocase subunit G [Phymatolithon calcareum]WEA76898.1 preprotein translocase subunit G [Phymatolithon calcareum]
MKLIWYTSSILTILLILINNPKSQGFGSIGNQSQLFSYTRSTQKNILILTTITASIFVLLTIILTSNIIT